MAMTLQEIKTRAKYIYDHQGEVNTIAEAKQTASDVITMIFYLTDHIIEMAEEQKKQDDKGD
jgi:hypothetical protein